jgi:hypothetical protein
MKVIICLEFNGVDANSDKADAIVDSITQSCSGMQLDFGASSCWVDDASNDDGVFMIQKYYGDGLLEGWQNVRDDGRLFDSKQEALEEWFEEELADGLDIGTHLLPDDIRIVEIKGVI